MRLPVLLAVDDDRDALDGVEAQLAQRYAHEYRVMSLGDPEDALLALQELADGGEDVALVLAASSLSSTAGRHLLEHVRRLHPHAGRALLVPTNFWQDQPATDAIRDSMALGRIDYYVPRPAGPLDEVFHEAISGFLLEWARDRRVVPQTVHIVGETWSGRAYELREVFEQCAAPHAFSLAASDQGRELIAEAGPDVKLPLMVLPGGLSLSDPSDAEIAEIVGAPVDLEARDYDVVIVGAGPAGLSAAVYGASEGLSILVLDELGIGGQARSSSLIRNYLGFAMGVTVGRPRGEDHRPRADAPPILEGQAATRSSRAAEIPPTRRPCTSRGTRAASRSSSAGRRSAPGCRTTWCKRSRRRRTWWCARAPRWSVGAATAASRNWSCGTAAARRRSSPPTRSSC